MPPCNSVRRAWGFVAGSIPKEVPGKPPDGRRRHSVHLWRGVRREQNHKHNKGELSFSRYRGADACRESYKYNRKTGILAQEFTNGTSRVRQVFTSGPLAYRRVRWTKETNPDGESVRTDYTYDEAGHVVYRCTTREGEKAEKDEVWVDKSGRIVRRRVNGKEVPTE